MNKQTNKQTNEQTNKIEPTHIFPCALRYQFPFNPPVHTAVSTHQVPGPEEPDPLSSEPAASMLRLAWNLGWHESLERLCQIKGVEREAASETDGSADFCVGCRYDSLLASK